MENIITLQYLKDYQQMHDNIHNYAALFVDIVNEINPQTFSFKGNFYIDAVEFNCDNFVDIKIIEWERYEYEDNTHTLTVNLDSFINIDQFRAEQTEIATQFEALEQKRLESQMEHHKQVSQRLTAEKQKHDLIYQELQKKLGL